MRQGTVFAVEVRLSQPDSSLPRMAHAGIDFATTRLQATTLPCTEPPVFSGVKRGLLRG